MAAFPKRIPLSFRNGSGKRERGMEGGCALGLLFSGCCIWTTHTFSFPKQPHGAEKKRKLDRGPERFSADQVERRKYKEKKKKKKKKHK
jgi:hypothetical protein